MLALPAGQPGRTQCDYCYHFAVGEWHAAWTIADFGEWQACDQHRNAAGRRLERRTVDGLGIVQLWWQEYWYDEHYSFVSAAYL